MKEFIIKDDTIHLSEKNGFDFVTNDEKDKVSVFRGVRIGSGFSLPQVSDKRSEKTITYCDVENYEATHENYINYLDKGYSGDWGIVVRPDFIWFTILCEISSLIKKDPELFRLYFSDTQEKQNIFVHSDKKENGYLPVDDILVEVMKKIPSNIREDLIVPNFTTLDEKSSFAFKCAFLDTVSPFYNYGVLWCGYNKIKVLGEKSDYELIGKVLQQISLIIPELTEYYQKCQFAIDDIVQFWDDVDFWKNICKTDKGYGSRIVDGWFTEFYLNSIKNLKDFPEHLVKVNYSDPSGNYTMYVGILSSRLEDGYMIPDFNKVIAKIK